MGIYFQPEVIEFVLKGVRAETLALLTGEPLDEVSQRWDLHIIRGEN